ncbi:MAG: helix-turn-helix transcriptional regulator [Nannocystis sp.]|uniref:helix-turn-helix transcriptional regulator n=1 Tax=Nannocystis sp. TaxID=1962667 RepID=UPI0024296145|nr:helix-turn-helix transcriptional regulator [Nannocystis sp.]MBK9755859.1 helix-turn-helix transcriptional regulator [Nannocystis sp.]
MGPAENIDIIDAAHNDVVGSPSGTIAGAGGCSPRAREPLRAAAVAHDRARLCRRDADDPLDLHRALVAGCWHLVDTFERDGKRYLIARRTTPAPTSGSELSVRETQVAVFAAMGHALKVIAYELGVSESSVATYLRRALVKLRLPDRIALTRQFAGFRQSTGPPAQ